MTIWFRPASVHLSVRVLAWAVSEQKSERLQFGTYTPLGQALGILSLFWSLWHIFYNLSAKVHFSVITKWKIKMAIFHHLFDLHFRCMVSNIESIHWELALAISVMTLTILKGHRVKCLN